MKGILFLFIICIIYYYYCRYYEQPYYNTVSMSFIVIYIILYYFVNYQTKFTYKIANNLKNVHTQPLHSLLPDYKKSYNPTKVEILSNQHFRCNQCKKEILINDIDNSTKLSYIQPINIGGNNINNLQVLCNNCFMH